MKNDYKALIERERIRLNDGTADFNNLQAALAAGSAVYVVDAERAIGDRILGCKGKLLSLPTRMARVLAGQGKASVAMKLRETLEEVISELKGIKEEELMDGAISLQEYPELEQEEEELNTVYSRPV